MSAGERLAALCELGYTAKQASFIEIAAPYGYFLRRHVNTFLQRECGAIAEAFIRRATEKGHAAAHRCGARTVLYHLCGRAIYAALGDEENRNRRRHALATVKRRVMALDFVLGLRETYVPGFAAEKRELLQRSSKERLDIQAVQRLVTDRLPVFEAADTVGVVYVDEGATTLSGFNTFLETHENLFTVLDRVHVVYVTSTGHRLSRAERTFTRFLESLRRRQADSERLLAHFQDRHLFETGRFSGFDQSRLDQFRRERAEFSANVYNRRYAEWVEAGCGGTTAAGASGALTFSTTLLNYDYSFLGSWER